MKDAKRKTVSRETVERYCHIVDANVPIGRYVSDGRTVYECMERGACEKSGGCRNARYGSENGTIEEK